MTTTTWKAATTSALAGPGVEKVAGASGYDWEIGLADPQPQDADLDLPILPLDILQVGVRDRYNEVEALSGGPLDDKLRGDDIVPSQVGGAGFIGCSVLDQNGVDRIAGLNQLIPTLPTPLADVVAASASKDCPVLSGTHVWGDGNILLGGGGSDTLEGRGADDVIDGDRYLNVRLSVRDASGTEIGSATGMTAKYLRDGAGNLTGQTLQEAVFAGTVDPGNIVAVRELLSAAGGTDSAVFSDVEANYTVTTTGGTGQLGSPGSVTTVVHNGGTDGTDTLRNIERLLFSDSVAPAAPVIGAAIAGNGQATVNFTPAAGATATGFNVRVLNAAGTQVGALRTADAGTTSLVVTGLTNGQTFRFQVQAVNALGASVFSALSNAAVPAAPVFAGAPAIGTATAGNAQVTVRWSAPAAVANAAAVTQYRVRVFVGAAATPTREVTVGNVTNTVITGLINGTGYTFDVSAINSAGTGAASARSALTTPRTEFVAPTITARTPASGARSVSQTANITATFSEPVANVSAGTVVLRLNGSAAPIPASVTYNNATRTVTVNPNATLLADRTYNMAFSSVRDTAGNSLAASGWQFTTGPAPTVAAATPANRAVGVRRTANVTVRFSEPIATPTSGTVVLRLGASVIPAVVTYNAATRTATLNPSVTLLANRTYTMAVSVRDLAGNPTTFGPWTFTTGSAL